MITLLKRITRLGFVSFKRQAGLGFATIFIMVITISLITGLFLSKEATDYLIVNIQEKVDISVYFKKDSTEDNILKIRDELSEISEVKEVEYVSKDQALERFTEKHKNNILLMEALEEVGGNPFLASLNVRAWKAAQYETITNFLNASSFNGLIDKVDYHQNKLVIDKLFSVTSWINQVGVVVSFILVVIAVLVIFTTVRLAISNSKEEISVMRLVGASNWFIRGPFIIQGIIIGTLATVITFSLFAAVCFYLSGRLETVIPGLNFSVYFSTNFITILLIQFATAVGLGTFSSWIAVRKYLKV